MENVAPLYPGILPNESTPKTLPTKELPENSPLPTKSYRITFKNGQAEDIQNGDIAQIHARLSQGTAEAVSFSTILSYLKNADHSAVFVDECLTHMHSELEKYLIWLSFLMKKENSQLFFTTHNTGVCDLRLPTNSFLFLKREKNGTNTALWANSRLKKDDRNFRNYYENDYFNVYPDYSDLASILADTAEEDHG